ncbi:MAG TPA: hypothetical protein VGV89_02460 [Thermoplasmata archaeon]|nr:hypothetical protein [Thermoplasmata archaeon]
MGELGCPACGEATPSDRVACPKCGLPTALFEPVRLAAGSGHGGDPHLLHEILALVGADRPSSPDGSGPGDLAHPPRFPSAGSPTAGNAGGTPPGEIPAIPALGAGEPRAVLRRQIDELLTVGRRLGLDLAPFDHRVRDAVQVDSTDAYENVRRELFVHVAATLAEQIEIDLGRRNELASVIPDGLPDGELESARGALLQGDLSGAQRTVRAIDERLSALEEEWETVQVLSVEAELLLETLRELGGDPTPLLAAVESGRASARSGDRETAERVLTHAVLAVWHVAAPLLLRRITQLQSSLADAARAGQEVAAPRHALVQMGRELRLRNFGGAITEFRRARDAVAAHATPPTGS